MRKKETVDYTHASGAERRILLGDLQITKGLFTKVKISILCVCVYVCWEVGLYSSSVAMHPQCVLVALCACMETGFHGLYLYYKFTALPDSRTAYVQVMEF